ncbi:MAG: hypothetical protein AAF561_00715 [Planctomycetota bacterium]
MASDPKALDTTPPSSASSSPDGPPAPGQTGSGGSGDVLSESALGRGLVALWEKIRDNQNLFFIAVIGALGVIFAFQWKSRQDRNAEEIARNQLVALRQATDSARQLRQVGARLPEDTLSREVARLDAAFTPAMSGVQGAPGGASSVAWRTAGDFHWYLATLPTPLPATRPDEPLVPIAASDARLDQAADAYARVVEDDEASATLRFAARFGLASVAEERGDFDQARVQYDALLGEAALPDPLRQDVEERVSQLDSFSDRSPLVSVPPPSPEVETPADTSEGDIGSRLDELLGGGVTGELTLDAPPTSPVTRPTTRPVIELVP